MNIYMKYRKHFVERNHDYFIIKNSMRVNGYMFEARRGKTIEGYFTVR